MGKWPILRQFSTYDLAIQEREADLVIGTFGRSMWVLDDIRPLRVFAKNSGKLPTAKSPQLPLLMLIKLRYNNLMASDLQRMQSMLQKNREFGGRISFIMSDLDTAKLDTVTIKIFNAANEQIRT